MLTGKERERYDRQMMVYGFGEDGQEKLKRSRVLIAGAGGLGSPVAIYLTAAGVGTLRIVDDDTVDLSNLNRQVLHWVGDIGREKATSAQEKLKKINPHVKIEALVKKMTGANVDRLITDCDIIVDALDNLPSRYLLNRVALYRGIPLVHGAVYGFEGRVMTVLPGKTACLNCLYRGATLPDEKFPVIGVTPAVIGCIQATEVIKYIVGLGKLLTDRILAYDALEMSFTELKVKKDPCCEHCGNPDIGERK